MQRGPDTVPDELPDDGKSVLCDVLFNGAAYIEQTVTRAHLLDGTFERFLGDLEQFLHLLIGFANRDGDGRIAEIAVQLDARINRNDVTLPEHSLRRRHPVHDLVIHRSAENKWILRTRHLRIVALECGPRPGIAYHLFGDNFELQRSDAFLHHQTQLLEDLVNQKT